MSELNLLERAVMEKLLAAEDEVFAILREQLEAASVSRREMTGVGFFSHFSIPEAVRRLPGNRSFKFGDVMATLAGLNYGAGFLLYIEDGLLSMLEGYSFEEPWPQVVQEFEVSYTPGGKRNMEGLRKIAHGV